MRHLVLALAATGLLSAPASAQDAPVTPAPPQVGSSFGEIGEALPPPVLPAEEAFVEAVSVNQKIDMIEGFRIFDDGRYEIYGDKVWIRMPDGSVRWTPVPLGWHPLKTLDATQVTSIAYAARESGIMKVEAVLGTEDPPRPTPVATPAPGEAAPDPAATWTWTVRLDGDVHTVKIIGYPRTRSPEAEHLFRQVQSIAFEQP